MNLVSCGKSCIYQKDGWCTLEHVLPVSSSKSEDCCYYQSQEAFSQRETPAPAGKKRV